MKIKWFGHSCFLITSAGGINILTDPFDASVGYKVPVVSADIVTISHAHRDHSDTSNVLGDFMKFDKPGRYLEKGITIKGISSFHDDCRGAKRGDNIVFNMDIDGISVCHCGDIGQLIDENQKAAIGKVDILLVPVGGFYTVGYLEAYRLGELLKPKHIIPMHFKTPEIDFPIEDEHRFIEMYEDIVMFTSQEIEITKQNLSGYPKVIRLKYA
jgi:L-ascorbate metabolism protein UlaG (beta-lactamase superfamily)